MAYTLKDLDNDIQAGVGLFAYGLDVSEEADIADENLFRAVYERRRAEWVAQERRSTENHVRKLGPVAPEDEEAVIARERADATKLRGDGSAGFFIAPHAPLRFDEAAARRRIPPPSSPRSRIDDCSPSASPRPACWNSPRRVTRSSGRA